MREIRFRAWDSVCKTMWAPDFISHQGLAGMSIGTKKHPNDVVYVSDKFPVMQFTGLKDKNGKEIYEGDIVTHPLCVKEPHGADEKCETFIGRIQYEVDRGQMFAVNVQRNGYVIVMSEAYKFEVIGNIYENPELLK